MRDDRVSIGVRDGNEPRFVARVPELYHEQRDEKEAAEQGSDSRREASRGVRLHRSSFAIGECFLRFGQYTVSCRRGYRCWRNASET